MNSKTNDIFGLVLAGGKSKRMGRDKGMLKWRRKEQQYVVADMLSTICSDVFISCRPDQLAEINTHYKALPDTFLDLGPFGGILSALRFAPDQAWMVIACDLPLLDDNTIQFLLKHRNKKSLATAFISPFDGLPEPLITIWEPQSYQVLLQFLGKGVTCPRKVLIKSNPTLLHAPHPNSLLNCNTPEDVEKAKASLHITHAI